MLVGLNLVFCANNSFCVTNGLQTCHCFCAWICHMNAWKLRSRLSHFWNPWYLWNLMQFFFQGHRKHLEHFTFCSHSGLNLIILCCSHISVGDNQNEGIYIFYRTWLKKIIKSNCQWKLFLLRTLQSYGTWPIINFFFFFTYRGIHLLLLRLFLVKMSFQSDLLATSHQKTDLPLVLWTMLHCLR